MRVRFYASVRVEAQPRRLLTFGDTPYPLESATCSWGNFSLAATLIGALMYEFFPTCERVIQARTVLATGHFGELEALMGVAELRAPSDADLSQLIDEFQALAAELGLNETDETLGFVVLVPVTVNRITHTTPVLVDTEFRELSFTSHPELGAGAISGELLVENPRLVTDVRDELLGVIATWHNRVPDEE